MRGAERAIVVASAVTAVLATGVALYNVVVWPAIHDWDASGHAVNVIDLHEGHYPNPHSWCGSHPPLYYLVGAALWRLLPEGMPVHVSLRLVSVVSWLATVALVWRWLRRLGSTGDAALVAALMLGVPGYAIAAGMMTNDALCTLLTTATLLRLLDLPGPAPSRQVAIAGVLAGLAAMTKATGIAAVGLGVLVFACRGWRDVGQAVRQLAVFALASSVVVAPHYLRLFVTVSGSPYDILAARAGSREKEAIASVIEAVAARTSSFWSYVSLQHAAMWGDPTAVLVPRDPSMPGVAVWWAGWLVVGVGVMGLVRLMRQPALARRMAVALAFGAIFAAALLPHIVNIPHVVLTKSNYLMPEVLPLSAVLAVGLGARASRLGVPFKGALVLVSAGGVAFTGYGGWSWSGSGRNTVAVPSASGDSPVHTVARYFKERAGDPIRAAERLAPSAHEQHGLRLVRILGLPPAAEPGLSPADERSLELARARVAWLELYNLIPWMQPTAGALDVRLVDTSASADAAEVRVRVGAQGTTAPPGAIGVWPFPEFEQRFVLGRFGARWRITSIQQSGVVAENAVPALVAAPTADGLDGLRAIGWRPNWEAAVATGRARLERAGNGMGTP